MFGHRTPASPIPVGGAICSLATPTKAHKSNSTQRAKEVKKGQKGSTMSLRKTKLPKPAPSQAGQKFFDIEVRRIRKAIEDHPWRLQDFYQEYRLKFRHLCTATNWNENIKKVIAKTSKSRINAQIHHRIAIATIFGWTSEGFEDFLVTGIAPDSISLENAESRMNTLTETGHAETFQKILEPGFVPQAANMDSLWNFIVDSSKTKAEKGLREQARYQSSELAKRVKGPGHGTEVIGVYALKWLAGHGDQLAECRAPIMRNAIEWTLHPDVTWNISYRSFCLASALAATYFSDGSYYWRDHPVLSEAMEHGIHPVLGSVWIIPIAIFFSETNDSEILVRVVRNWFDTLPPERCEQTSLNIATALRTFLIITLRTSNKAAISRVSDRLHHAKSLIDFFVPSGNTI